MNAFWQESFLPIWSAGGPLMYPLAALAALIFFTGMEILIYLKAVCGKPSSDRDIEAWVEEPAQANGEIRGIVEYGKSGLPEQREVLNRFGEIRNEHLTRVNRRRVMLSVFVGAAPLTGLLGTVMGMLSTFRGMSINSSGQTVNLVADGISEALITTQLGLVIAIPGYLLLSVIEKRQQLLDTLIMRIESAVARRALAVSRQEAFR